MLRPALDSDRDLVLGWRNHPEVRAVSLTQHEIAQEIGVTQTQVSRLLGRIYAQLRTELGEDDEPGRRRTSPR